MNYEPPYFNYGMYNNYNGPKDDGFDNTSYQGCKKECPNKTDGCMNQDYPNYYQNTTKTMGCPTYQNCQQTVESCNIEEIPHYINYHTHNVYNVIKRHINIPTCSSSSEVRVYNEYQPITSNCYGYGNPYQGMSNYPNYTPPYQGLNNFFVPFPNI